MNTIMSGLAPAFLATGTGITCAIIVLLQFHFLDAAITKAARDAGVDLDGKPGGPS
jgi:biopolymer transport protein ExbB/TolQ